MNRDRLPNLPLLLNPLLFMALLWIGARAFATREWRILAAMTPFVWTFLFHALLTHNNPRFHEPLLPLLWVCAAIAAAAVAREARERVRRLRAPRAADVPA